MAQKLLTVRETAQLLNISEKSVWNYTSPRGGLIPIRLGNQFDVESRLRHLDGDRRNVWRA